MKIQFPVSANDEISMTRFVVLNSYFTKAAKRLKEFVGFSHNKSITRSQDSRKVYVCVP